MTHSAILYWDFFKQRARAVSRHIRWDWVKTALTLVFFALVATLLYHQAANIEWSKVWQTLHETSMTTLLVALALAFCAYSFYASYDLFGRYLLRLRISAAKTWLAACLSYAFNLNLSSLVGGVAFRYRLYSQLGLTAGQVTRVLGISVVTNWLGYVLLAGLLFVSGQVNRPDSWALGQSTLQGFGALFIAVVLVYLALCWLARGREYRLRSLTFTFPSLPVALLQLLVACGHWTLMASVIYQFLAADVSFPTVFAVLLVSSMAGVITHIPGGIGVLEAVFLALLSGQVDKPTILAGLFAYRCVFYLIPLLVATPTYLVFEAFLKSRRRVGTASGEYSS